MAKPLIIDGIDISRKYHIDEIMELYRKGRLRKVAVNGYIVRADADGMVGFVPASKSTLFNMGGWQENEDGVYHGSNGRVYQSKGNLSEAMRQDVEKKHPMIRRTAQQKRTALVQRLLKTARVYGTVPGLTDEQISTMIGEPWVTGVSIVSQQMLDRVAEHLLGRGEADNKEADRKRTTRQHALA